MLLHVRRLWSDEGSCGDTDFHLVFGACLLSQNALKHMVVAGLSLGHVIIAAEKALPNLLLFSCRLYLIVGERANTLLEHLRLLGVAINLLSHFIVLKVAQFR
jgi:hypothetical protein